MSLMRKAVRGAGWGVASGYIAQLLSFAMFVITSRLVGPAAFGAVAIALGLVELCRAFTTENVAANLIANSEADIEDFNAGFSWALASTATMSLLLVLLSPLFATLFRTPSLANVLPQIALLLLGYGFSRLQEARMIKIMRFELLAGRTILAASIAGAVGIWAALHGAGVEALVYQQWTAALVSVVLLWTASDWRPGFHFTRAKFLKLQRASLILAPANLVYGLTVLIDGLAVAMFAGPAAAGIYNLGKRVVLAMVMALSSALDRVSLAAFAQVQQDRARLMYVFEQALSISMLVVAPVFIGIAAIGPELIALALGPQWQSAALPMALLLVAGGVGIATSYFENLLLVLERRRWIVAMRTGFVVALLLGIAVFGHFGPVAIAVVSMCAALGQNIAVAMVLNRVAGFSTANYVRCVGAPFVLALAMFASVTLLRGFVFEPIAPMLRLPLLIVAGAGLYASGVLVLARPSLHAFVRAARAAV